MKKLFSMLLCGAMLVSFSACEKNELTNDSNAGSNHNGLGLNGHEGVDLDLPSGTLWATCNVGATNPEDYGEHFAWGETQSKSNYDWSTYIHCNGTSTSLTKYTYSDNKLVLEAVDDAATVNWGGVWRTPTADEYRELLNECTWSWTTSNGVCGYRVVGKNDNSIFLPAAGFGKSTGLSNVGSAGSYWSSLLRRDKHSSAEFLDFHLTGSGRLYYMVTGGRAIGRSIRPVYSPK